MKDAKIWIQSLEGVIENAEKAAVENTVVGRRFYGSAEWARLNYEEGTDEYTVAELVYRNAMNLHSITLDQNGLIVLIERDRGDHRII